MLTRDQVTAAIREWMERVQEADGQVNAIGELFGDLDYDAPLPAAIEGLISGYTKALSRVIGDEGEWLGYFRCECNFGANPLAVIPDDGCEEITIDGPEAIAEVICWDREHVEAAR